MAGHPAPLPRLGPALLLRALATRGRRPPAGAHLAPVSTDYVLERLDPHAVRRYAKALGFPPGAVPLTFHYLLAQRAHLGTMLDPAFAVAIPGLIHVENVLAERHAPDPEGALRLATTARVREGDTASTYCELETVATQDGREVFHCTSTYLARRPRAGGKSGRQPDEPLAGTELGNWFVALRDGRRYAAISGDWNPIHLWPWSARLMGMRAPIIHGMHTVGRACALVESLRGRRVTAVGARFQAPIPLGSQASLVLAADGERYAVRCGARDAVSGWLRTA